MCIHIHTTIQRRINNAFLAADFISNEASTSDHLYDIGKGEQGRETVEGEQGWGQWRVKGEGGSGG